MILQQAGQAPDPALDGSGGGLILPRQVKASGQQKIRGYRYRYGTPRGAGDSPTWLPVQPVLASTCGLSPSGGRIVLPPPDDSGPSPPTCLMVLK